MLFIIYMASTSYNWSCASRAGQAFQEASAMAGVQISRRASYRLLQKVPTESAKWACKIAGMDAPLKLREPVRASAQSLLPSRSSTPSHIVQQALENRFGVEVCISHLNATRAGTGPNIYRSQRTLA